MLNKGYWIWSFDINVGSYLCSDKCLPYRIWRLLLKEAQPTKKALTHILNFLQSEPQSFGDKKCYEHIMLLQKQKRALMALAMYRREISFCLVFFICQMHHANITVMQHTKFYEILHESGDTFPWFKYESSLTPLHNKQTVIRKY